MKFMLKPQVSYSGSSCLNFSMHHLGLVKKGMRTSIARDRNLSGLVQLLTFLVNLEHFVFSYFWLLFCFFMRLLRLDSTYWLKASLGLSFLPSCADIFVLALWNVYWECAPRVFWDCIPMPVGADGTASGDALSKLENCDTNGDTSSDVYDYGRFGEIPGDWDVELLRNSAILFGLIVVKLLR